MHIPWIDPNSALPSPELAQDKDSDLAGLVAAGNDLTVQRLQEAYKNGIFPWFSEGQPVLWWSPDPRMVLKTNNFKLHHSLKKTLKNFIASPNCGIHVDRAFEQVIRQCAQSPRRGQSGTWIVEQMISAYIALHEAGMAHSIETWVDEELVGGLYCVSIGSALFGESMFSKKTDASKIALAGLVAFAHAKGLDWIDCQQNTKHLTSLGAREVPRSDFLKMVRSCVCDPDPVWEFSPDHWNYLVVQKV